MKFLLDAQLPQRLAFELITFGHDTRHTVDLIRGNTTPDNEIAECAAREKRILVTKDSDFVTTFLLKRSPPKLLLLSTGNINTLIFSDSLPRISSAWNHRSINMILLN